MRKGLALLIGVNQVDPAAYGGEWDGKLNFCESDATVVAEITQSQGFENTLLLTADATREAVQSTIREAAARLEHGDMFTLFYSGHGNSIADRSGDEWADNRDETWCLYDGQLLDDELFALWPSFQPGVRILVLSDSCHSGSITRGAADAEEVPKAMPENIAKSIVRNDPEHYVRIRQQLAKGPKKIGATIRLISGCKDYQQSFENQPKKHGLFTAALLGAWQEGSAKDYNQFKAAIEERMPKYQNPNLLVLGADNEEFSTQKPFTI